MNELILVRAINDRRAAAAEAERQEQAGKPARMPVGGNGFDQFPPMSFPDGSFDARTQQRIDARWKR